MNASSASQERLNAHGVLAAEVATGHEEPLPPPDGL